MRCSTNYAIQCLDVSSGKIGCFLFDVDHWKETGEFKATSPVFYALPMFFDWDDKNGHNRKDVLLTRKDD